MANNWSITGRKLGDGPGEPASPIDISEEQTNITMPDGTKGPYGIAVDAPLGVTLIRELWKKVADERDIEVLRRLLQGSFAITLDKAVLLKTISQPRCEGVRFYLGMKQTDKKEDVLTLVTVGVDEKGKDLSYDWTAAPPAQVPTRSLVAEYGHPPGVMAQSGTSVDPFVLFRLSQNS